MFWLGFAANSSVIYPLNLIQTLKKGIIKLKIIEGLMVP